MARFEATYEGKQGQALVKTVDAGNEADAVEQLERDLGREVWVIEVEEVFRSEMQKTAAAVLERIGDKERWCQIPVAENARGQTVSPFASSACRWCLFGAWNLEGCVNGAAWDDLARLSDEMFGCGPIHVNDEIGHDAVVKLLRAASE